jgi:tRNA A37 N6-isopentenylltransferase MiaA
VERIKFDTHRFIRQQANWFRQDDTRISWFDVSDVGWEELAAAEIDEWRGA